MAKDWTGGCGCGAVRYRLASDPFDAGWCHCRTCQLSSGSPALVFATVPVDDFVIEQGEALTRRFASSNFGQRLFCSACGTPLLMQVDHQPETVDIAVATLDEPGQVAPGFHIFYGSRIAWADADDGLPRHDRFRRDTVGLAPGEQP